MSDSFSALACFRTVTIIPYPQAAMSIICISSCLFFTLSPYWTNQLITTTLNVSELSNPITPSGHSGILCSFEVSSENLPSQKARKVPSNGDFTLKYPYVPGVLKNVLSGIKQLAFNLLNCEYTASP
jgi:hypothetical protein